MYYNPKTLKNSKFKLCQSSTLHIHLFCEIKGNICFAQQDKRASRYGISADRPDQTSNRGLYLTTEPSWGGRKLSRNFGWGVMETVLEAWPSDWPLYFRLKYTGTSFLHQFIPLQVLGIRPEC